MTPLEILEKGLSFIDTPKKWTQGVAARDSERQIVSIWGKSAVCFCSEGALYKAANTAGSAWCDNSLDRAKNLLKKQMRYSITSFNDSHCYEDVIGAWERAIAEEKELASESQP